MKPSAIHLALKLGARNLSRNKVRTLLNVSMIVGAFCSIILFRGFANSMLKLLSESITQGEVGHLQVATKSMWKSDLPKKKQDGYIENGEALANEIEKIPGVLYASPRAEVYVLLANGSQSIGALAKGTMPERESLYKNSLNLVEGSLFSGTGNFQVLLGSGIQDQLKSKTGQSISIVAQSLDGTMTSLEPEVQGIVKNGMQEIDNSTVYVNLQSAQKLLATDRAERVVIVLKETANLALVKSQIKQMLQTRSPNLEVRDWQEIAHFFRQITEFYEMQNAFIEIILAGLVFFGILNTIGMSIYERTGEIGTLRALGDQRSEIIFLLLIEGLLLGLLGTLIGAPLGWSIAKVFSSLGVEILLPGASLLTPIHLIPTWMDFLIAGAITTATVLISTLWPAIKSVKMNVVDALRANI